MPTGTIKAVTGQREWTGNYGTMIDHEILITVDGKDVPVYMTKKVGSPAPSVGESMDFEKVKQDQHGIKIKKVYDTPYTPNGSSGGANPDRDKSIQRQTAAKCAAQVVAAMVASGKLTTSIATHIETTTDAFYNAINQVYPEPTNDPLPTGNDPLPADTDGIDTPAPADDLDQIPF